LLDSKNRKGATITNFLLIIGLIFVSVTALGVLRRLALSQASQVETDYTVSMAEEVKAAIEKAASYPSSAEYTLKLNDPLLYTANITGNKIFFTFKKNNITKTLYFFSANSHIIPSSFENSGIIHIYKKDSYIYVTNILVCNTTNDICDPGCIALGICDPACRKADEYNTCSPYCLDKNNDEEINRADSDALCIPACYSTFNKGFYDFDCIESGDGICEPATNSIKDGVCDTDCLGTNGVCDPDCTEYDADCPHKGNNLCEPERGESCLDFPSFSDCKCASDKACKADCAALLPLTEDNGCINKSLISKKGQDCIENCQCSDSEPLICDIKFGTKKCCPEDSYFKAGTGCIDYTKDNQCNTTEPYSENCENSKQDCSCGTSDCCPDCVSSEPNGCCPAGKKQCEKSTGFECITPGTVAEKGKCECNRECASGSTCSAKKGEPNNKACCPNEKEWNGVECEEKCTFTMLFIQINSAVSDFENKAKGGRNVWASISPMKNCAERVCYIADNRICNADVMDAFGDLQNCANAWGYSGKYHRIIGITPGDCVARIAAGCIRGYTQFYSKIIVSAESSIKSTCSHELGHTFGLCDEGYGGGRCSSCPTSWYNVGGVGCYDNCYDPSGRGIHCCPNIPEQGSIMCSQDPCGHGCTFGDSFGSTSYSYLENELASYCN